MPFIKSRADERADGGEDSGVSLYYFHANWVMLAVIYILLVSIVNYVFRIVDSSYEF